MKENVIKQFVSGIEWFLYAKQCEQAVSMASKYLHDDKYHKIEENLMVNTFFSVHFVASMTVLVRCITRSGDIMILFTVIV